MSTFTNYSGGIRNAPRADIAAPSADPDAGAVATFSSRQANPNGTGHIINNAGRGSKKPHSAGGFGGQSGGIESPLDLSNVSDIIEQSGLGRRQPATRGSGEQMSDANAPTQSVNVNEDGTSTHYRDNRDGTMTGSPLGAYANVGRRMFGLSPSSSDTTLASESF